MHSSTVIAMRHEGHTAAEISRATGVSVGMVRNILYMYGHNKFTTPVETNSRPIPPEIRAFVCERDHYICQYCGRQIDPATLPKGAWAIDHIRPRADRGTNDPDNLCFACTVCNNQKIDKSAEDFRAYLAARLERIPL